MQTDVLSRLIIPSKEAAYFYRAAKQLVASAAQQHNSCIKQEAKQFISNTNLIYAQQQQQVGG